MRAAQFRQGCHCGIGISDVLRDHAECNQIERPLRLVPLEGAFGPLMNKSVVEDIIAWIDSNQQLAAVSQNFGSAGGRVDFETKKNNLLFH